MPAFVGVVSLSSTATPVMVDIVFIPSSGDVECVEDCFVIWAVDAGDDVVSIDSSVLVCNCVSAAKEHVPH